MMTCTSERKIIQEFLGARQRPERRNDLLDVGELEAVLVEDLQPAAHELVIVRFVAGRAAQFLDARLLGHRNPNLGSQHSLHVQGYD